MQNRSKLPTNFVTQTDQIIESTNLSHENNLKIIQSLDPSKSLGPGKISVGLIKV